MATISKVIGFAREYYTLWNVAEVHHYRTVNGKHQQVGTTYKYNYIQNLSKEEEKAVKKVAERYHIQEDSIIIDEGLRGITTRSFERYIRTAMPYTVFPYGKRKWEEISESSDIWQLEQVFKGDRDRGGFEENGTSIPFRRRALARRRLIELGELIRFDHEREEWNDSKEEWIKVNRKYMSKRNYENHIKAQASRFLHDEGEKVEVSLKCVQRNGYDSAFGYVYIITYENENGENYYYKGGTPPDIELGSSVFVKVRGTVKHSTYKDIKQTLLQRIKIIK